MTLKKIKTFFNERPLFDLDCALLFALCEDQEEVKAAGIAAQKAILDLHRVIGEYRIRAE